MLIILASSGPRLQGSEKKSEIKTVERKLKQEKTSEKNWFLFASSGAYSVGFSHFLFLYCWLIQFFFSRQWNFAVTHASIKKFWWSWELIKNFACVFPSSCFLRFFRFITFWVWPEKKGWVSRSTFIVLSSNFTCTQNESSLSVKQEKKSVDGLPSRSRWGHDGSNNTF